MILNKIAKLKFTQIECNGSHPYLGLEAYAEMIKLNDCIPLRVYITIIMKL